MNEDIKLDKTEFLRNYNISAEDFEKTGLIWEDLLLIFNHYSEYKDSLEPSAQLVFNLLMKANGVHSVRYRIKDPEHLIDKIIRKKIIDPELVINVNNYKEVITDLIGLRALHLFKEDWEYLHDYIVTNWNQHEQPTANYRGGDLEKDGMNFFESKGCVLKEHKYGYRSVHYVIDIQPVKERILIEIQVRTIYEEAWSEIDHKIRYPNYVNEKIYSKFLGILNRLSGGADEMGSFLKFLRNEIDTERAKFNSLNSEYNATLNKLEQTIKSSKMTQRELNIALAELDKLRNKSNEDDEMKLNFSNTKTIKFNPVLFESLLKESLDPVMEKTKILSNLSSKIIDPFKSLEITSKNISEENKSNPIKSTPKKAIANKRKNKN